VNLAKQIRAPLELWVVDCDGHFIGLAPAPALAAAIRTLAQRAPADGQPEVEESDACAVRLTARRLADGTVAVASLALDGLREAEDALKRFDMVVGATRDAVWDWNDSTKQSWWNRQQFELLGLDPDTTVPSFEAWAARIHPDDRERLMQHIEAAIASGAAAWQGEYRFLSDNDGVRVALDRGFIERDANGKLRRMVGVMSDITAERSATAALKASEERFREMTSAIDQLFWLTNPDETETLYASPAFERIWGRSLESAYRDTKTYFEAIHEDDRARVEARRPLLTSGEYDEVYRIRRPDGTIAWIRSRAFPIRDAAGKVVRIAGVATDITAQRELEQQLAQAQRMDSIGRLAGGIAHDFNNLLTVILSTAQALLRKQPPGSDSHGDLEAIRDAGERAARLTSQLLTFARRQVVAPVRLDLNDVVRQIEGLLQRTMGEHIELRTALAVDLGPVKADRAQLEQVVVNLAINARDAMPDGGRLTIETCNAKLGLPPAESRAGVAAGDYVVLTVSDTGVGIPSENLPHVFEPFFTTKPTGQGTGLGLATCHGIVHKIGGVIRVDSTVGSGTTITISLPRVGGHDSLAEREPSAPMRRGTETVLFVEDDPAVRKVGVRIFAEQNYRVLEAPGGRAALELAAAHSGPIHLLVTDVVMPNMSGVELARRLIEQRPDVRVLYTSGYTDNPVVQRELGPGFAFLQKPYVKETLLDKTRDLLDAKS
jgi:two-component system, cell cycle sensor histidine kinase and response regulator CckA